jgi:uncharacterized membrane protein YeaQ/YmgE (transglycosylase-associated protein family)
MVVGVLGWIVFGLIAGYVASTLANKRRERLTFDMCSGVWGALIGGWVFNVLASNGERGFSLWSLPVAGVGAVLTLSVWCASRRSVSRASTSRC